ncbi:HVA22-like protein a isoform X2 [Asparagus officinalis]|uniref:HVA22-like protein a isoform X2 n=1 Tax=Asparagus officinalis TaxID=4686 RepID=UPI00098DE6C4|nr:HVA22-like protein a isoform X2 [Asparagus officinalis]
MGSGSFFKVLLKNFDVLAAPVVTLVYPLLPFWSFAKLIFNCWLVLPYFSGAAYVYQHYVRPLFVNQPTVNIWYVPRKKSIFSRPDDFLVAAEKFIQENGPEAFQKLIKKAEKAPKPSEKAPKPSEKAPKPSEKAPKPMEKIPKPKKTNRRVTFDDVKIEKASNSQKSANQTIFDGIDNHSVFDNGNSHSIFENGSLHPIFDEYEEERGSKSWGNSSFMIFDDDYRY